MAHQVSKPGKLLLGETMRADIFLICCATGTAGMTSLLSATWSFWETGLVLKFLDVMAARSTLFSSTKARSERPLVALRWPETMTWPFSCLDFALCEESGTIVVARLSDGDERPGFEAVEGVPDFGLS